MQQEYAPKLQQEDEEAGRLQREIDAAAAKNRERLKERTSVRNAYLEIVNMPYFLYATIDWYSRCVVLVFQSPEYYPSPVSLAPAAAPLKILLRLLRVMPP